MIDFIQCLLRQTWDSWIVWFSLNPGDSLLRREGKPRRGPWQHCNPDLGRDQHRPRWQDSHSWRWRSEVGFDQLKCNRWSHTPDPDDFLCEGTLPVEPLSSMLVPTTLACKLVLWNLSNVWVISINILTIYESWPATIILQNQTLLLAVGQGMLKKEARQRETLGGGLLVASSSSRERRKSDLSKATWLNLCWKWTVPSISVEDRLAFRILWLSNFSREGEVVF